MLYCFLASGFEETEAIATVDTIRRAEIDVTTVGIGGKFITGNHGITVVADITEDKINYEDMTGVILPGGIPGTLNLEKSETVQKCIAIAAEKNLLIGAICAAPSILGNLGLLNGKKAVCFDGYEVFLTGAQVPEDRVVSDGNIVTGRAVGTAIEFGLEIVRMIEGDKKSIAIGKSMKCQK